MDLKKPLDTIATTTRDTVRHPVDTGLKAVGLSIGLVRGAAEAVAGVVAGHRAEQPDEPAGRTGPTPPAATTEPPPEPVTITPDEMPTPADLAERIERSPDVTTPVGTTGAGHATNPDTTDTDLQQPGTEPLMDPATTKAVASEQAMMSRAADTDKG
jgi:hypothetical protein